MQNMQNMGSLKKYAEYALPTLLMAQGPACGRPGRLRRVPARPHGGVAARYRQYGLPDGEPERRAAESPGAGLP